VPGRHGGRADGDDGHVEPGALRDRVFALDGDAPPRLLTHVESRDTATVFVLASVDLDGDGAAELVVYLEDLQANAIEVARPSGSGANGAESLGTFTCGS
jgi:hypothetical protein